MNAPSIAEITGLAHAATRNLEGFLGAIVLGSVSAGMQDETSDYDLQLVFTDEAFKAHPEYADIDIDTHGRKRDIWSSSLSDLKAMDPAGDEAKEYVHAVCLFDRSGALKQAVRALVEIPGDSRRAHVAGKLDAYYNALFRSLKCRRHGYMLGFYAMAVESVKMYIDVIYGINGTIAPFINRAPFVIKRLERLPAPAEVLVGMLENICKCADVRMQIALFDMTSVWMAQNGYRDVQDAWEGVLEAEVDAARNAGEHEPL